MMFMDWMVSEEWGGASTYGVPPLRRVLICKDAAGAGTWTTSLAPWGELSQEQRERVLKHALYLNGLRSVESGVRYLPLTPLV